MAFEKHWNMQPNLRLAKFLTIRDIPALVYDAVNLEGIAITLPEVQALLDGVTVGGYTISDQNIVLNQAATWKYLLRLIDKKEFSFSSEIALQLHEIAAREEAFEWGVFRSGNVSISGTDYTPPKAEELPLLWQDLEKSLQTIPDIYDKAITAFLQMARNQFFWDVNKRTGRFMMNGILLAAGYPVINLPVRRQLEFNQGMLSFYLSNEMDEMNAFLRSCLDERIVANFR